jgi:purine-binding chemotaxis protein CheW
MDRSHLIFCHRGARYGIDVAFVREIVWLPELSPVEEVPPHVVGAFDLRGQVVPVMDLGLHFGHPRQPWLVSDRIVVIERDRVFLGIIASELEDVLAIAPQAIEDADGTHGQDGDARFVRAQARLEQGLAMLLDADALLSSASLSAASAPAVAPAEGGPGCGLSVDDVDTLHRRKLVLAQVVQGQSRDTLQAFAVIKLGGELFGLDLALVCGFSPLRGVAPLPCCPPHVVGNMNLRGEILTLVDIRPALGMAQAPGSAAPDGAALDGAMHKVVVLRSGDLLLGLPAQEIVDVVHLAQSEIAPLPLASSLHGAACCKGVATVDGHAVALLDLHKILAALQLGAAYSNLQTDRSQGMT